VEWKGEGLEEQGFIDGKLFLTINEKYYRPAEVDILLGDPSKIKQELGWKPKFTFDDLVTDMMVEAEWRYSNGERITNV
jgi:GDPmannose 4,6-dehydratase